MKKFWFLVLLSIGLLAMPLHSRHLRKESASPQGTGVLLPPRPKFPDVGPAEALVLDKLIELNVAFEAQFDQLWTTVQGEQLELRALEARVSALEAKVQSAGGSLAEPPPAGAVLRISDRLKFLETKAITAGGQLAPPAPAVLPILP